MVGKVKVQSKYDAFGRGYVLNMKLTLFYTVTVHLQCYDENLSLVKLKNIVNFLNTKHLFSTKQPCM